MKKAGIVMLILVCVLSLSCAGRDRVADFTLISSKNISTLEGAQKMGVFEGKDCKQLSPFRPPQQPNLKEALDRALEDGKGNAMVDAVVYFKPAVCMFDESCWEIKGTVLKTKDMLLKGEVDKELEKNYSKEIFVSANGHEYYAFKRKGNVNLDHDKKHYDLIIRIK